MRNLARGALAGLVPPVRTRPLQSGGCGSPARPPGHAACGRPPRRMHRRRGCSGRPGAPAACPTKPTSQRARARWPGAWLYAASRGTALCRHGTSPESNPPTARLHHPGLCAIRPGGRGGAAPGRRPAGRGRRRTAACPRSRACRRSGPAPSAAPARARAALTQLSPWCPLPAAWQGRWQNAWQRRRAWRHPPPGECSKLGWGAPACGGELPRHCPLAAWLRGRAAQPRQGVRWAADRCAATGGARQRSVGPAARRNRRVCVWSGGRADGRASGRACAPRRRRRSRPGR